MPRYIAAIDQGTTSTRCMLFDRSGPVGWAQKEHRQIYPRPGDIAAVGITNQRETTVVWDRRTGRPLCHAIVWQDTRTKEICDELARTGGMDRFRPITGLPLATYFSGPKLRWILENVPGTRRAACHRSDPCVADDADESADAGKTPARSMRTRMSAPPGLTVRPVFGQTRGVWPFFVAVLWCRLSSLLLCRLESLHHNPRPHPTRV